ncbi:MAG: flippase-like domain-containing protein [Cyanobacteria bacterium K_Offshore_0m_m2_072]|nr:flippase-like domain-containing protein [Cyanobacteria bacterium K_Offshore_0m_m2_072]
MKTLVLLAGALLVYGLLALAVGWGAVSQQLGALAWWIWPLAVLTVVLGYGLLFVRWQLLLRCLGRPLPARASGPIYLAGLGLIAAPARSGEALRAVWLHRRHQIPVHSGVAATVAERLLDLASALLVLAWGLGLGRQRAALAAVLVALAALAWLMSHPTTLTQFERAALRLPFTKPWRGLRRVLREGLQALAELRSLLRPSPLLLGLTLSTAVWLLEGSLLQLVLQQLGATSLSLENASVVRTATSLGGVLSLLPAGLGTSELTSIGLAVLYGASNSQAVAATVLLRVVTLFLPCLVGLLVLKQQPDLLATRRKGSSISAEPQSSRSRDHH